MSNCMSLTSLPTGSNANHLFFFLFWFARLVEEKKKTKNQGYLVLVKKRTPYDKNESLARFWSVLFQGFQTQLGLFLSFLPDITYGKRNAINMSNL